MTYAAPRRRSEVLLEDTLAPTNYATRELRGVTTVDAYARRAYWHLFGSPSVSHRRTAVHDRVAQLHRLWTDATRYDSSLEIKRRHPAFRHIVALGDEAIPVILDFLAAHPDHLVMALKDITHEDPVLPAHRGRFPDMVNDWITWGREHGHRR